ncbi:hypothetical protein G184_gp15 [Erwinia phage ENT90]|uniref:Uncharacterized protein n=1 Tax=Erwinia phage ENT90 TaxID=947843 RepID=F1BUR5_9CAUD|nr:hypothetical protein G184_gp15 [Erwinia phage ENT90]ADX32452.1 hypothetical protein [Erwinia phage ENT90]
MQVCSSANGNTLASSSTNSHISRFWYSDGLYSSWSWSRSNRLQPPVSASSTVTICRHWPSPHSAPFARCVCDRSISMRSALLRRPLLNSSPDQNG